MGNRNNSGGFTLPGESGYEKLTLELAERWGADVIRDSDGTTLSDEIINAGYGIYSTICIIRDHQAFAKAHPDTLQQTFLMTEPIVATEEHVEIALMKDFYEGQFRINSCPDALHYWQVYDRTTDTLLSEDRWVFDSEKGVVVISDAIKWHSYTVSFMAYRIWEEISMYNHVTNDLGDKEHLMPIDPMYPEVREYMLHWMENWCEQHPATTVVRFTSMFYNFVWIWGKNEKKRNLFTDWASYDFTVSDRALKLFKEKNGYEMTAEDFIHQGKLHVTHMPADERKLAWMEFINDFVVSFGKQLIDVVHRYGKKAYVFYDDSWVGIEPYGKRFSEFGFDGMIKCVFSGYEARLCSGVKAETHEIRLHPYLFPVGLGGLPTFMEGGDPARDAYQYWAAVRRGLLRAPIQRIGLGGYLHLLQDFPDFVDCIENIADEFRTIRRLHEEGAPLVSKVRVAVLHYWGSLRSWTLSGHFHETYMNTLIHVNEALAGMPFDVSFINFDDVKDHDLSQYSVIINAGKEGDAWSGGDRWKDAAVVEKLTEWVYGGGVFIGINEPSAAEGYENRFRMSHVLGVDLDRGERVCHGKWKAEDMLKAKGYTAPVSSKKKEGLFIVDPALRIIAEDNGDVLACEKDFGKGKGIYLSDFEYSIENAGLLEQLIYTATGESRLPYSTDNVHIGSTIFPASKTVLLTNYSNQEEKGNIHLSTDEIEEVMLKPYEMKMINL